MASLKSNLLLAGVSKEESCSKGESSSSRRHVSKQQSMQSMCMTTTSSSHGGGRRGEGGRGEEGEDGEEDVRTREVGEAGEDTLSHVCGLVFNAVCKMIARSHSQMSAGLGGAEEGRQETSPEVVVGRLSRSFVDLTGQKTVRFQYSQTVDNPRAVFADFAHRFDSVPPLKLEAQIQLSVPRIHMEPRLSDIHVHLAQVTSVLLSVLHKLSWWAGPGAGREFHVIWDASGAVDHMHNEILERFRSINKKSPPLHSPILLSLYSPFIPSPTPPLSFLHPVSFPLPFPFTPPPLPPLTIPLSPFIPPLSFLYPLPFPSLVYSPGTSSRRCPLIPASPRFSLEGGHACCLPGLPGLQSHSV